MRETLLTVLEALRHAVSMYRIKGARAFQDALVSALVEMQMRSETMKKAESEPETSALRAPLQIVGRIEHGEVPSHNFACHVSLEPLRSTLLQPPQAAR